MTRLLLIFGLAMTAFAAGVRVRRANGSIATEDLEKYVAEAVAGESSVFRSNAGLAAMAVAARTYAVRLRGRHASEGYDFCSSTHCQRLDPEAVNARVEAAVAATAGVLLWYQGKPAFTPYSRDCGSLTQDASMVWPDMAAPYLSSHRDPYCVRAGSSAWQWSGDPREIAEALRRAGLRAPQRVESISTSHGGTLMLTGGGEAVKISASSFRFAIGRELGWNTVRSDVYEVHSEGGRIVFRGRGEGHGVGLCQHGADEMGVEGKSYREILAFYYPGTSAGTSGRGITWQRIAGDTIALLTTSPSQDSTVLADAERELRAVSQRTGWSAPQGIEIRVYPDMDTYRDATGEPGWVAAHTVGTRIHLQPAAVLRSRSALAGTLRHELVHVVIESQAAPTLPLWFREGLAGFVEDAPRSNGPVRIPAEADLRQTSDRDRARRAYADAIHAVADLASRYGEGAVFDWVHRGLPAQVRNTSESQAATKQK